MVNFEPAGYMREMFFQSVTQAAQQKNPGTPIGVDSYDLLLTTGSLDCTSTKLQEFRQVLICTVNDEDEMVNLSLDVSSSSMLDVGHMNLVKWPQLP